MSGAASGQGVWAIVVAAGRGTRLGLPYNKVFFRLAGRSVLSRSLDALCASGLLEGIVLVLAQEDRERYDRLVEREGACPLVRSVVDGGGTRQESVYRGLCALPAGADIVAVHDAARPFVSVDILEKTIESARRFGSGVISVPVKDTIKQVNQSGLAFRTLERERLRAVQTPQTFRKELLLEAYRCAQEQARTATDDASLVEALTGSVHLVEVPQGERNIKLTTPEDLKLFEARQSQSVHRVGTGYDVHRLAPGRKLVLCGVEIPFEKGLLGHSDADVATHALMDALLGAMGEGDIGRMFPDSDPQYQDACSLDLLAEVVARMEEHLLFVVNCDLTIVAQRPKLAAYVPEMRMNLARVLKRPVEVVNVKATTTEGLGFEGEGLGMSAQAIALLDSAFDLNI